MKTTTCVELLENFMFRTIGIQVGDVANVPDAIAEAADLKVPLGEGLDVLDLQSTICKNRTSKMLRSSVSRASLASIRLQQNLGNNTCCLRLTVGRRHVCYGDASNLRVTEAKQECSVGLVFENQVQVLLSDETKYQPGKAEHYKQSGQTRVLDVFLRTERGRLLTSRSSKSSGASWSAP